MAKFPGNCLKDSTLSLFNNTNIIFPQVSQFDSKMPLVNFFLDSRYDMVWLVYCLTCRNLIRYDMVSLLISGSDQMTWTAFSESP